MEAMVISAEVEVDAMAAPTMPNRIVKIMASVVIKTSLNIDI